MEAQMIKLLVVLLLNEAKMRVALEKWLTALKDAAER